MAILSRLPARYRVDLPLGSGGFGEVYKVHDSQANRDIALKILHRGASQTRATLAREFKALSQLQHPGLVRVFDFGIIPPNTPYFTMEWIDGLTLKQFFSKLDNILLIEKVLWQILSALSYLHRNGILHGDVKPENIMISGETGLSIRAKLLDFGLASALERKRKVISGTPRFLAPEILKDGAPYSRSTDLYALGITVIESITDIIAPVSSEIGHDFFMSAYDETNNRLRASGIKNPSSIASFVLNLCKPDPSERESTAESALRDLEILSPGIHSQQRIELEDVFVGRTDEMRQIGSFLKPGYSDKKVLIVRGPTGIGKKTIVERAVKIAELRRFIVIDLPGSLSSHVAFARFIETITSYMNESQGTQFWSRYKELTEIQPAMAERAELQQDSGRALIVYDLIVQALHEISQDRPILLVLCDMDRHSEDLFRFVLHLISQISFLGSKVRLIITFNSDMAPAPEIRELQQRISSSSLSTLLELGPFGDEQLRHLLIETFEQELLSDTERHDLITKTRGIPLIVMAFIRQLVSSNVFQFENDRWTLDRRKYKQSEIPQDIDSTFGLALRDISESEEALLQILAVYGRAVTTKELASLTSSISGDSPRAIEGLTGRMVLEYDKDGALFFSHPLYMQYILAQVSSAAKKRFNHTIAEHMVSQGSKDYRQIAQHYIAAEELDKAIEFGLQAADLLSSSYVLYDALRLLQDLRDLAIKQKSMGRLPDILVRLGPVEHQTGLPKEAIKTFSALHRSATRDKDRLLYLRQMATIYRASLGNVSRSKAILRKALRYAAECRDRHSLAEIHYQLGCYLAKTSILHFEKAAELSTEIDPSLRMKSLAHLLYVYKVSGQHSRMSEMQAELNQNMAKMDSDTQKEVLLHLSSVHFYSADYDKARYYMEKKIGLERIQDDVLGMVYSLISLAGYCFTEGSYYDMITTLKEAYSLARRYNILAPSLTILANLSLAYRNLADYGQASRMIEQAEALMKEEAIDQTSSYNLTKPTELFLQFGQTREREFRTYARKVRQTALKVKNNISLGHYNMSYSRYYSNGLRMNAGLRSARAALELFRKAQDRDDVALALTQMAILQIAMRKTEEASSSLNEASSIYDEIHCEYLKPLLMLAKGMLARLKAEGDAKSILAEGLRTSKRMGTREITWQIQREFALYYEDRGELNKALSSYRDAVETIKQITESIDDEQLKTSYLDVPFRRRVFDEIKELKKKIQRPQ